MSGLHTAYPFPFKKRDDVDRSAAQAMRNECRNGGFSGSTSGRAPGFVQANLVILPKEFALEFATFCLRNSRACPLLDVTEVGSPEPSMVAPGADLRTDLPKYRIWINGKLEAEVTDITDVWRNDFVGFVLGCSFSFEAALAREGLEPRNVTMKSNVSMYRTTHPNIKSGPFEGNLVVSMRPYPPSSLPDVIRITSSFPGAHGGPIYKGKTDATPHCSFLGIGNLGLPDFGDPVPIGEGEIPVFWACGVTPQVAIETAAPAPPIAITHAPGHMFVTDLVDDEMRVGQPPG